MNFYDPCAGSTSYLAMASDPGEVAAFCATNPGVFMQASIIPTVDAFSLILALSVCAAILFRQLFSEPTDR